MTTTPWFAGFGRVGEDPLLRALRAERVLFDSTREEDLAILREDVGRIADAMDLGAGTPPMYWSGVPLPRAAREPSTGWRLVISVGGTKTEFALLRLEQGALAAFDPASGRELRGAAEIEGLKRRLSLETPRYGGGVETGQDMLREIARRIAAGLLPSGRGVLERCRSTLLSWGFAHSILRSGPRLADGGVVALSTLLTKDQARFTTSLRGQDIGGLLRAALGRELDGWDAPVVVANDSIMALHWFLGPRWSAYRRAACFINGTGTNFAMAEPCAVRPEGWISCAGHPYQPARVTRRRPPQAGESVEPFFINFESGTIRLGATHTRFDKPSESEIESNALAGGNAFAQMGRELVAAFLSPELDQRLRQAWAAADPKREAGKGAGAREWGELAAAEAAPAMVAAIFGGVEVSNGDAAHLQLLARAIVSRSALHAALILAAVTLRSGFGRGGKGRRDLLGMEGSVWKIAGYPELVRLWWETLSAAAPLAADFAHEEGYNASLPGPLWLAALHPEE